MRSGSRCPAFYGEIPPTRWGILDDDGGYFHCITYNVVYPKGIKQFKKDFSTFMEVGRKKSEWAKQIGRYMVPERNASPSFQSFWRELTKRAAS